MFTTVGCRSRTSTPSCLFLNRWPLQLLLIIICLLQLASCHKNTDPPHNCPPSSCGNIQKIKYPFRLDTDPPDCGFSSLAGDKNFTLSCHSNSSLFWYSNNNNDSGDRLLVKGINYDNFTIHLIDQGVQQRKCSSHPTSPISVYSNPYYTTGILRYGMEETFLCRPAVFVSCDRKHVVNYTTTSSETTKYSPYFLEITTACKSNRKKYSYLIVGGHYYVPLKEVMQSCSIDMITLVQFPNNTMTNVTSYQEIHTQFSYGFHLSWFRIYCLPNCSNYGTCLIDEANRATCKPYYPPPFRRNYYDIGVWFWFISGSYYASRRYLGPIFNIIGWFIKIFMLLGALRVAIGSTCVLIILTYQWRRRHLSLYDTIEEFLQNHNDLIPIRYSYKHIKKITSCFKIKLGEGGFGCVYKGKLRSGRFAAIKILRKSFKVTNGQDFMNEVATIGRIHHVNVVQLIGYCAEQSKRALVYDFMSNGSLDKYIFAKEGSVSLSWDKLFEISLGVARGIEYLHRGCDMHILHFDIKPHNILLDENFIPKVCDFGLAKLYPVMEDNIASLTAARGTIGYMAPELFYKNIGRVSYKADVYSFGMMLLEIAGKRKNLNALVENSSQIYFPSWIYDQVSNDDDIKIGENVKAEETKLVKKMIKVGLWCIQMKPTNRPSMSKVLEMLEGDMESLEMPPKPTLYPEEMSNVAETSESSYLSDDSK